VDPTLEEMVDMEALFETLDKDKVDVEPPARSGVWSARRTNLMTPGSHHQLMLGRVVSPLETPSAAEHGAFPGFSPCHSPRSMPSSTRSKASAFTSNTDVHKKQKNRDFKVELRQMRDTLYQSAQSAFSRDVWEHCGIEADHLKKHQLAQLLGGGFAAQMKKKDDDAGGEGGEMSRQTSLERRKSFRRGSTAVMTKRRTAPRSSMENAPPSPSSTSSRGGTAGGARGGARGGGGGGGGVRKSGLAA